LLKQAGIIDKVIRGKQFSRHLAYDNDKDKRDNHFFYFNRTNSYFNYFRFAVIHQE